MDATVVLGQQGRVVIPADVRAALGLQPGEALYPPARSTPDPRNAGRRLCAERASTAALLATLKHAALAAEPAVLRT